MLYIMELLYKLYCTIISYYAIGLYFVLCLSGFMSLTCCVSVPSFLLHAVGF